MFDPTIILTMILFGTENYLDPKTKLACMSVCVSVSEQNQEYTEFFS